MFSDICAQPNNTYYTYYIMHMDNRLDIIYEPNTRVYIREIVYLLQDLFV